MSTEDRSANVMGMMSEATEAAAGMLPMDMVHAIAELTDPAEVAKEMPWLAEELTNRARQVRHLVRPARPALR